MRIKTYIYTIAGSLMLFFSGCYKDLGNYDYTSLPEIKIDSVKSDYGTLQLFKDTLKIRPIIQFGEEGNESFTGEWFRVTEDSLISISKTIDLNWQVNRIGITKFVLKVTHKNPEFGQDIRKTQVAASSEMERGFYILKATKENNTEMDAFLQIAPTTYELHSNLISQVRDTLLLGPPADLDYFNWIYFNEETKEPETARVLRPMSEKELAVIDINNFSHIGELEDLLIDEIPYENRKLERLISTDGLSVLIYNNGKIRTMTNNVRGEFMLEIPGDYQLAPTANGRVDNLMFWDETSSSVLILGNTVSSFKRYRDTDPYGRPVPTLNYINANLKYSGNTIGSIGPFGSYGGHPNGIGSLLLESKTNPDSLMMYRLTHTYIAGNLWFASALEEVRPLENTENLKKAEHYSTFDEMNSTLYFYTAGNKLYNYDIITFQDQELKDFGSEEITYMKYIRWPFELDEAYRFYYMLVGTHLNGKYKLYLYEVTASGELYEEVAVLEGEGRIKDVTYASPHHIVSVFSTLY